MADVGSNESIVLEVGDNVDIDVQKVEGGYTVVTVSATGGGGSVAIQEESVEKVAEASALNFDGDDFDITDAGSGVATIDVAATHAGSTHSAATDTHIADTTAAHAATAVSFTPAGTIEATTVQAAIEEVASEAGGGGAPTDADYLVGTANGDLSNEIVVGTTPGGELGGTWASPTVDATHAGSTHSAATDTHIADATDAHDASAISVADAGGLLTATDVEAALAELATDADNHLADAADAHDASAISIADAGGDFTATTVEGALDELQADNEAHVAAADPHTGYILESLAAAKGDLFVATADNTPAVLTVGANDTILMADSGQTSGHKWQAPASTSEIADIADAEAAGTSDTWARGDHVHSGAAYRKETDLIHLVTFSKTGNLSTGTGTLRWYNDTGVSITLASARGSVGTAPANQSILVDINNNGTSVWNATQANRITIAAAGNTDEGGAFDDATIADGEYITVDIDQVGTGTVGADLTVSIWGTHS